MKILMICLGNICRSPLAEGIMRSKIIQNQLDWEVDSAGTSAYHSGEQPDPRSIQTARNHGLDISQQRSRQITLSDLDEFDQLYVMDSSNYNNVKKLCKNQKQLNKIQLIMNAVEPASNRAVPDPYWDDNGFEKVYQMLDKACDVIVAQHLQKKE